MKKLQKLGFSKNAITRILQILKHFPIEVGKDINGKFANVKQFGKWYLLHDGKKFCAVEKMIRFRNV